MGKGPERVGDLNPRRAVEQNGTRVTALAPGIVWLLSACATTIVPPDTVNRPASVFVLDHGAHTSLALPHAGDLVRYAYGDWRWYAERQTGFVEATRAVLWPTPGALGKGLIFGSATGEGLRNGLGLAIEALHEIRVEADRVAALRSELDGIHTAGAASLKYNAHYGLAFAPHPAAYTFSNNSNRRVADWLRRLGCDIEGSALWASWTVRDEPGAIAPPR